MTAKELITRLVEFYFVHLNSYIEILKLLLPNKESMPLKVFVTYSFADFFAYEWSTFIKELSNGKRAIISYWNGLLDNGTVDVKSELHTVFLERTKLDSSGKSYEFKIHNIASDTKEITLDNPLEILNTEKPFCRDERQFVSGVIINEN